MSATSKISQRKNYHLDNLKQLQNSNSPEIHIFCKDANTVTIQQLQNELRNKSYPYQLHQDFNQLNTFISSSYKKMIVLISTEDPSHLDLNYFPQDYRPSPDKMVRLYTFPTSLNGINIPNLPQSRQIMQAISSFDNRPTNRIKLSSVHSIKVSKDKKLQISKSIKDVNTESKYQKVFYFQNSNSNNNDEQQVYNNLTNSLEGEADFQSFKTVKDLEKMQPPKGKNKYMILASTSPTSIRLLNDLKKTKIPYFDCILLGQLNPNEHFLDNNVILASNDPVQHLNFLSQNGFPSSNITNIRERLMLGTGINRVEQNIITNMNPPQIIVSQAKIQNISNAVIQTKIPSRQSIDGANSQHKKIKKIKSPSKARINEVQSKTDVNNINIVVSQHKDEPIVENNFYRTNKQGQKIIKQQIKSINSQQLKKSLETPTFVKRTSDAIIEKAEPSSFNSITPSTQNQFLQKNVNVIESKYRNTPQVVIQQMSEQYRGSNRESIMNLEPQKQKIIIQQHYRSIQSQPFQQVGVKKIVNKGISYSNEPDTYYINSKRTIESIKTNPNLPENTINHSSYQINKYSNGNIGYSYPDGYKNINGTSNNASNSIQNKATYKSYYPQTYNSNSSHSITQNNVVNHISTNLSPNSRKIISASPISVTTANNQATARTYGYQSPSRVVRKIQVTEPEQVIEKSQPKEQKRHSFAYNQVRQTFGSHSPQINHITYYNSNDSSGLPKTYQSTSNNYYNAPTLNYYNQKIEPYDTKIQISTGKTQQIPSQKGIYQEETKTYNLQYNTPLRTQQKEVKKLATSTLFNRSDYDQVERDGKIYLVQKNLTEAKQYNPINYVSAKIETKQEGSPTVRKYEVSPLRRENNSYQHIQKTQLQQKNRVQLTKGKNNYEIITIPYKSDDHNLGQMIESSHKKKSIQYGQTTPGNSISDNKNFVSVSYRNYDNNTTNLSNYQPGVRVYGVSHPRIEVEKNEKLQPRVEAKRQGLSPLPKVNPLNESNWFSRMSELHSDGSILRRNNIRFGIKLHKKQEINESKSVLETKMASGIFKLNDLNKKMALNRIIRGEEFLNEQKNKYTHISTRINRFHFIIQDEMEYLVGIIKNHIAGPFDKIDTFKGISSLFNYLKGEANEQVIDVGFIFAKSEQLVHVNSQLIPQNYFSVQILKQQQGLLDISQAQKYVKIDQLKHFSLVQKIILDSKLYQYVAYRNNKKEIELLADKFMNSEFILEKIETEFTTQIFDCYYYELPRLTRLYMLCNQEQLRTMLSLINTYAQINPNFNRQTCKLICVLGNILDNDQLIMNLPNVTFISNPEEVKHYRDILKYAHHSQDRISQFLPIDNVFYYYKHTNLQNQLAYSYPGRFSAFSFSKVSDVYPKIDKMNKMAAKSGNSFNNYLVLHENVNSEKIRVQFFTKIFMLGKAKVIQNKVVRVMNTEELLELLKK